MTVDEDSPSLRLSGAWWMWRDAAVRASGFPIDDLLRLGQPKLAASADSDPVAGEFLPSDYWTALEESCVALAEIADSDTFREAVLWQNRGIIDRVVDPYVRTVRAGAPRDKRRRQREDLLTRYVQRYHAKNESVGFFGAVGWARWADPRDMCPDMTVTGFHSTIVNRRAQLETWPAGLLANQFSADSATRRWLSPVLAPMIRLADGRIHTALRGWFPMQGPRIDVLAACDGKTTIAEIAERLIARQTPGIASVEDVERILAGLQRSRFVSVGLEVPPTAHPDQFLRRQLESLPDPEVRGRHLSLLRRIESAADRVRAAAGNFGLLAPALSELDATFTEVSGQDPHRVQAGRQIVGRSLMVEDCRSAISVTLGPALLTALAAPLDLLLTAARWLVDQVAAHYLGLLDGIYEAMAGPNRSAVGLPAIVSEYWPLCAVDRFTTEAEPIIAEFHRRWAQILPLPAGVRRHAVAVADLAAAAREQFAATSAPWLSGRFHAPDLMIAASDVEAVSRGDYQWVLGEMHCGVNTLNQSVFVLSHPEPDRIAAMADEDAQPSRWMVPIYPSDWPHISGRAYPSPYLVSARHDYLRLAAEPPRDNMTDSGVPIGALIMTRDEAGTLLIRGDDGRQWHPLAVLGEFLVDALPDAYQPLRPASHRPRVSIDRLTISREQWRIRIESITWPAVRDEADRYRAARQWALVLGLPRYVFIGVAGEFKPFYVDLTSPLLLNMITKTFRRVARDWAESVVTVTEMYPGPDELWAPHSGPDRRCTSELRMAIVDRAHE